MRLLCLALLSLAAACTGAAPDQPAAAKSLPAAPSPALRESVQRLTTRKLEEAPAPGGYRIYEVEAGSQVVVAKAQGDGGVVAKCVESADDGFLGAEGSDK